jgi:hypothetical protein
MRTQPILGRKVWFGPRRFGWGLEPVSVEGWLVAAAAVLLSVLAARTDRYRAQARCIKWLLLAMTLLKGTAPGGPASRRRFHENRAGRTDR